MRVSGQARAAPAAFGPLAAIRAQFPGWNPWRSDAGRFWATRKGRYPARPPGGYAMTVDADDAAGLREAIEHQEELAVRAP